MNTTLTADGWDAFWRIISKFDVVKELDLSNCFLEEKKVNNMEAILKSSALLVSLKSLSLYGNSFLSIDGWSNVFKGLN